jgi:hypothetical protein
MACFLTYLFFLAPRQFGEVLRPVDWLTKLRWWILGILILTMAALIPSIPYQYFIATGQEYDTLRNISSIAGGINLIGSTILMVLVFTYKRED